MNLYDNQHTFVANINKSLAKHKHIIGCAATGFGKTVVLIHIIERALLKGRTVLVLTEDTRIFNQTESHRDFHLINAGVGNTFIRKNNAYLAMAQTLMRRPKMIENFAYYGDNLLIIVDECHIATSTKILHQLQNAYIIGFTATPDARIAKHLPQLYKDCVVGPQPAELVQCGQLTPYKHYCRTSVNTSSLKLVNGEYSEESQEIAFNAEKLFDELASDIRKFAYRKCSIYTASIKHCEMVCNELEKRGILALVFHSKIENASYQLQQFTNGNINVCVSVMSLTKGFNLPVLDLIVLYMKTNSLAKYLQICGRGSRKYNGKHIWNVIDFGNNGIQHGSWDMERDWQNMWCARKRKSEGVAPIKICPSCDFMLPATAPKCTNCGYIFPKKENDPGETILVELNQKYTNLVGRRISSLSPEELADYVRSKNKSAFGARVAKSIEQSHPANGFLQAYGAAMGYKSGWATFQRTLIRNEKIDFTDFALK